MVIFFLTIPYLDGLLCIILENGVLVLTSSMKLLDIGVSIKHWLYLEFLNQLKNFTGMSPQIVLGLHL